MSLFLHLDHIYFFIFVGVLVYEMVMASTPFAPKKADNVTELFTNIAMVTVRTCWFMQFQELFSLFLIRRLFVF